MAAFHRSDEEAGDGPVCGWILSDASSKYAHADEKGKILTFL